jgi:hypothetical protein
MATERVPVHLTVDVVAFLLGVLGLLCFGGQIDTAASKGLFLPLPARRIRWRLSLRLRLLLLTTSDTIPSTSPGMGEGTAISKAVHKFNAVYLRSND